MRFTVTNFELKQKSELGDGDNIPKRRGPRPRTTSWAPHIQEEQNASPDMQASLKKRVFSLQDVEERQTILSDPRARAIWLKDSVKAVPKDASLARTRELGHFHPWDGSMHMVLPQPVAKRAVEAGWAEVHPVARAILGTENVVMIYGPRDEAEVETEYNLILSAYRYAGGREG